ncbi:hypothetical protein ACO1D0_00580 [Bacillus licheniformis]
MEENKREGVVSVTATVQDAGTALPFASLLVLLNLSPWNKAQK